MNDRQMLPASAIEACETPAFILDERRLQDHLRTIREFADEAQCTALYSLKALTLPAAIEAAASTLDGFSVSSLFEARLARQYGGPSSRVDYVSPLVRPDEAAEIARRCDRVTLNSLSQLDRFGDALASQCEVGLRVNPGTSWASNPRSDPCRADSKLGISLAQLRDVLQVDSHRLAAASGLHVHANHRSRNGQHWVATIDTIEDAVRESLTEFRWLNVGGGYLFDNLDWRAAAVAKLRNVRERYGLEIVIEPGAGATHDAGYFLATVEDIIEIPNGSVAMLDFSVNHWPELFEYQRRPMIAESVQTGEFAYRLAGCSCLAGDVLGEYTFKEPLRVGDRLTLSQAGAYSIGKAHTFNGINLPNVYCLSEDGELQLIKRFAFEDFAATCGVSAVPTASIELEQKSKLF